MPALTALNENSNVMNITMQGHVVLRDFETVNKAVNTALSSGETDTAILVIDFRKVLTTPHNIQALRASQTYTNREELRWICAIGENKFMRLIMTLTFNLTKAQLRFFSSQEHLSTFLEARELKIS